MPSEVTRTSSSIRTPPKLNLLTPSAGELCPTLPPLAHTLCPTLLPLAHPVPHPSSILHIRRQVKAAHSYPPGVKEVLEAMRAGSNGRCSGPDRMGENGRMHDAWTGEDTIGDGKAST